MPDDPRVLLVVHLAQEFDVHERWCRLNAIPLPPGWAAARLALLGGHIRPGKRR